MLVYRTPLIATLFRTLRPNRSNIKRIMPDKTISMAIIGEGSSNGHTSLGFHTCQARRKKYMVVGLGNHDMPKTRHSVGMLAVNMLAESLGAVWTRKRDMKAFVAESHIPDDEIDLILVKSTHPMNLNGKSVAKIARANGVASVDIYLLHDELDKDTGKFSLKKGGSARGHNGVKSSIASLRDDQMPRLRIGIDRPANQDDVADYVLDKFTPNELNLVKQAFPKAMDTLLKHMRQNNVS